MHGVTSRSSLGRGPPLGQSHVEAKGQGNVLMVAPQNGEGWRMSLGEWTEGVCLGLQAK